MLLAPLAAAALLINGSAEPTEVWAGEDVYVTVVDGPGLPADFVSRHAVSADDHHHANDWRYMNGTQEAFGTNTTAEIRFETKGIPPGDYNFRFFKNDTYQRLAISATLTVLPTPPMFTRPPCSPYHPLTPAQQQVSAVFESGDYTNPIHARAESTRLMMAYAESPRQIRARAKRWEATTLARAQETLRTACSCDTAPNIVIGVVKSREFLLSEKHTYVWGEYAFEVKQPFRGNLAPGQTITVTRSGGVVCDQDGVKLTFGDQFQAPLEVGSRYLLFLTPGPANTYASSDRDWIVGDDKADRAQSGPWVDHLNVASADLITMLSATLTSTTAPSCE